MSPGPDCLVFDEVIFEENYMPETVEALLWCAALATWLMMLFTFVREGVKKIVDRVRGRMSRQGKVLRSPLVRDGQQSRKIWRRE
jgi:hypothetical protein